MSVGGSLIDNSFLSRRFKIGALVRHFELDTCILRCVDTNTQQCSVEYPVYDRTGEFIRTDIKKVSIKDLRLEPIPKMG
jgi:hypothetical protein